MKSYYLKFGTGDPANYTGLAPTFVIFSMNGVTAISAPGVTETPAGSGLYQFIYGTTASILFKADGGAALSNNDRYIIGALDPIQAVDEKIGYATDSYGSTAVDPSTMFGYQKRAQEVMEGNKSYAKSSGIWGVYNRGSSTLLFTKTLTNSTTTAGSS